MIEEITKENELKSYKEIKNWLENYAQDKNLRELNSEEILKLFEKPIIISEIESAFNITSKELSQIRKEKGISNMYLEKIIRDSCSILYYLDKKDEKLSERIRNKIIKLLIISQSSPKIRTNYYKNKLLKFDFSQENVRKEIVKRNIDIEYRIKEQSKIIKYLESLIEEYKRLEKKKEKFPLDIIDAISNMDKDTYNDMENRKIQSPNKINISIEISGKKEKYNVSISEEKYSINRKKGEKRVSNGSNNNQSKNNVKKILSGKKGELIVLEVEKYKLKYLGLNELATKVELIAQVKDDIPLDGLGYDLISYNEQGEKICIEVKTNKGEKEKPFFISKKEIEVMENISIKYGCNHSLIYYVLDKGDGNITIKKIDYTDFKNYQLEPVLYKIVSTNYEQKIN